MDRNEKGERIVIGSVDVSFPNGNTEVDQTRTYLKFSKHVEISVTTSTHKADYSEAIAIVEAHQTTLNIRMEDPELLVHDTPWLLKIDSRWTPEELLCNVMAQVGEASKARDKFLAKFAV